jgi:hypothetical protein
MRSFITFMLHKMFDKVKEDEMGMAYSMNWSDEKCI